MEKKQGTYDRLLNRIEKIGNKLPNPIALFALFAGVVVVLSAVLSMLGVSATGELVSGGELKMTTVNVVSLLTKDGITYMLTNAVRNFTEYAPLGMTLVAMLGVGVAEQSGLINALLKSVVKITPARFITLMVVFLGVMSNVVNDAGYVVLIPLGAMIFRAYGRHPIAGLAAAFAGVSGGYSANLIVGALDALLAGISQTAATIIDLNYQVSVMGNYFFLAVSTFLVTFLGAWVTDKIVEPRLAAYSGEVTEEEDVTLTIITQEEKRGMKKAGVVAFLYVAIIVLACIPQNSLFRNSNGGLLGRPASPLIDSIVILIAFLFFLPGITYGLTTGEFKGEKDVCAALAKSMSSMGSFLVMAFVSAQFINYFNYTQIGTIVALSGVNFFRKINIGLVPLLVIFVLFSGFMNLFVGSSSAKWNILAPVFVPMFMLLGYTPELCQLAYRIGDSCTNVITPMMTYYAVILMFAQRYDKNAGVGTMTATMLPYSLAFLGGWTVLLILWLVAGLPIGVGTNIYYMVG